MRVRTDFFLATFEDLRDLSVPEEGPSEIYPTVEAEDIDIALLWELTHIVLDTDLETFLRDTHLVEGPETPGDIDKPTVELLPGAVMDTLLTLPDEDLENIAQRWSEVKEWRGLHSPEYLLSILDALSTLAAITFDEEKLLFLWTSVTE